MTSAELDYLIHHSREKNGRLGLTGVLVYLQGFFMQVLEGDPEVIDQLYSKILVDPRHKRITRIIYEAIPRRYFDGCPMAMSTLSVQQVVSILGSADAESRESLLDGIDEGRAKKLIRAFTDGRWRDAITVKPSERPLGATPA